VQSQNCNQLLETMFACFRVGAVWVPMNFRQAPVEIAEQAETCGAIGMICNADFPEHAAICAKLVPSIRFTVAIGDAAFGPSYEDVVQRHAGKTIPAVPVLYNEPCWFLFTSGTTGKPKAAMMTHGQLAFVINNHLADIVPGMSYDTDASLVVAPLSHGAGVHALLQVARGVKSILMPSERFDIEESWRLIERWKVSNLFVVPTILKMMVEHPSVDAFDHGSLRQIVYAGAPMYREDQKLALEKLGKVLVQYFGLAECTGAITVLPPSLHDPVDGSLLGTCGFERTGIEIQIQDDEGNEVPPGVDGEICVVGPAIFAGYFNNPEATAKAFRNGWLRTGDLGHVDERGFLFITGRASDMYISGGSNIYPREIEEKILRHPEITEVAVVGMPHPTWGEIGIAVCVRANGSILEEADMFSFVKEHVAKYKIPKRFIFWPELPKSGYGKITKKLIKEALMKNGDLEPST
jgi:acyl-CoA synthetase (AMP-forming)/AMP-acid ligase II